MFPSLIPAKSTLRCLQRSALLSWEPKDCSLLSNMSQLYNSNVDFSETQTCADPGIFVRGGGGPGQSGKKSSGDVFFLLFLVLSLVYRSQMVNFSEIYHFFKVPERVQHFPGGPTFPGWSNWLFPIETHINFDFPGGGPEPLSPPPPPLWTRTCQMIIWV